MEKKTFKTSGTCAKEISFEYENGKMYNLEFKGGCPGNLSAISKLCDGRDLKEIYELLQGNICGTKTTSCADQLTKAIKEVM